MLSFPKEGKRRLSFLGMYVATAISMQPRREAGLGNPPISFTNNASESVNTVFRRKLNY